MAVVPLALPFTMSSATAVFGEDDYTAALSSVSLDPSTQESTWRGVGGNVVKFASPAEWTAALGYAQDADPDGFSRYLHEHEGEVVPVTFTPTDGSDPVQTTVQLVPGSIGGPADGNAATATVSLPCRTRPQFVTV